MVSTNCTMRRAEATRERRNSCCERSWNHRVRMPSGTRAMSSTTPDGQSRTMSIAAVNTMYMSPRTRRVRPSSMSSRMASRSLVCREMIRPEVYDSWNSSESFWVCRNTRVRRSMSTAWLIRAESRM